MGTSIEDLCDGTERFLASSIPYLQLKDLVLNSNEVRSKLNAHCYVVIFFELVLNQSLQNAAFSDA